MPIYPVRSRYHANRSLPEFLARICGAVSLVRFPDRARAECLGAVFRMHTDRQLIQEQQNLAGYLNLKKRSNVVRLLLRVGSERISEQTYENRHLSLSGVRHQ